MKNFTPKQSIKMLMLCLIYVASCKTTDNQETPPPRTKADFIGASFKDDLKIIDRAIEEVASLRYQLPRNKGKEVSQLSYADFEETAFNRIAQDKGKDILAIYDELKKEPIYQELMAAQAKSLSILEKSMTAARSLTSYDLQAILSPYDELLNKTDVSEKYVSYSKALKNALIGTLNSHIQDMEKAKEIEDGEEVIKNYDKEALPKAFHAKINAIENEILKDNALTDGEKIVLLQTTTMTYEKANLITSILDEGTPMQGGRVQWSWKKFWKIAAIVVAVVVVGVVAAYIAPVIAPTIFTMGSKATAVSFLKIAGSILKLGKVAKTLTVTVGGIATAVVSTLAANALAAPIYCGAATTFTRCNRCNPHFLGAAVASCY